MDFLTRSLRIRVARLEHRMTLCQARLRDLEAAVLRAQEAPPPTYLEAVSRCELISGLRAPKCDQMF